MKKKKNKELKMVLVRATNISDEEVQRRWDRAFDILFTEMGKQQKLANSKNSESLTA